jgi:hypothetical protein
LKNVAGEGLAFLGLFFHGLSPRRRRVQKPEVRSSAHFLLALANRFHLQAASCGSRFRRDIPSGLGAFIHVERGKLTNMGGIGGEADPCRALFPRGKMSRG